MSSNSQHIIQSQQFHIAFDKEEEAYQLQSAISVLQESEINKLLNRILDSYSNEDYTFQFDQIELNLGTISKANYQKELLYRLEEELQRFFSINIQDKAKLRNGKVIALNHHKLEQLQYFLLNGHLRWDAPGSQSPSVLLKEIIQESPIKLIEVLKINIKKEGVRRRVVLQFNEEALESVVALVAKNEGEYMISYKRHILEQQHQHRLVEATDSSFRNAVWEVILDYLFEESGSYYNKKNFLSFLIRNVALKYNLSYQSLLEALTQGISALNEALGTNQIEFKKLLVELKEEQAIVLKAKQKDTDAIEEEQAYLEQVQYYLNTGTFKSQFKWTNSKAFNCQFESLIKYNSASFQAFLKVAFSTAVQKQGLLEILEDRILNQLLQILKIDHVIECRAFLDRIAQKQTSLSAASKVLLSYIQSKKAKLILGSLSAESKSTEQPSQSKIISNLLAYIQKELMLKQDILRAFLEDIRVQLKHQRNYYKLLSEFLKDRLEYTPEQSLQQNIDLETLISYTQSHKTEDWKIWIYQWVEKNRQAQTKLEFIEAIRKSLVSKAAEPQLIAYIETLLRQEQEHPDRPAHQLVEAWQMDANGLLVQERLQDREQDREQVKSDLNEVSKSKQARPKSGLSLNILQLLIEDIKSLLKPKQLYSEWHLKMIELLERVCIKYRIRIQDVLDESIAYLAQDIQLKVLKEQLIIYRQSKLYQRSLEAKKEAKEGKDSQKIYNTVLYVLENGSLPWWISNYNKAQFNKDFSQVWSSEGARKALLIVIQKQVSNFSQFLDSDHLKTLWKSMDSSASQQYCRYFIVIDALFTEVLKPLAFVTEATYQIFKQEAISFLLKSQKSPKHFIKLFENWMSDLLSDASAVDLLEQHIKAMPLAQTDIGKELEFWFVNQKENILKSSEGLQETSLDVSESLQAFLMHKDGGHVLRSETSHALLLSELKNIANTSASQFSEWLQYNEFRIKLTNSFKRKDILELIKLSMDVNQQRFFTESMHVLKSLSSFIDTSVSESMSTQFLELVLLRQGTSNGFRTWKIDDWANLIEELMNRHIGSHRKNELLLKLSHKMLSESSTDYIQGSLLLEHMQHQIYKDKTSGTMNKEEKPYRKLGEKKARAFLDPIYINNAGLILLGPYLGMLFQKCGLLENNEFVDDQARSKAVHLLEYAATGKTEQEEHQMIINKVLCGMHMGDTIERAINLDENDRAIVDSLLTAITQQWKPLNGTSINGLRESFIQREGKLEEEEEQYFLKVEQRAFDMLLDQISWNISKIKLSWMEKMLMVEWR